jgi:hypothetical protein
LLHLDGTEPARATRRLTLLNYGRDIQRSHLSDIGTSQKLKTGAVGRFGEDLKSALGPYVRAGSTVMFETIVRSLLLL